MSNVLDELIQLLALEQIEQNLFRGQSQDLGWGTVYGGQVLGQALSAATQTVPPDRPVHSLHAHFLRPGDVSRPILYDVDRIRDGSSFTTRRVVAIQKGEAIFHMAASFQKREEGFEHQDPMPDVAMPEGLPTEQQRLAGFASRLPRFLRERLTSERPIEVRYADPDADPVLPAPRAPSRAIWMRAAHALPDNPALHACLLAYASDNGFVTTALLPHGVTWLTPGMQVASLDHAMWFHHDVRFDQWLLHSIDSPCSSGSRGLVRGRVFSQDGKLVASTSQEGLIRQRVRQP
ncbi:MAG: acyl-CoA thioesterase II [Polyangiaceae bacterium]|jgi:acyl-CoA thioesterase-2|nr:acyl-CoA thioesterase II [Polyangiaceae bacterium]